MLVMAVVIRLVCMMLLTRSIGLKMLLVGVCSMWLVERFVTMLGTFAPGVVGLLRTIRFRQRLCPALIMVR